jgi:pyruvate dehydrogenase E2 component (dihydrolipoamide acetyltransferase)
MYEFKLPDLGEGIHEGEILKWHVNVGDMIKEDDPLVEVETDKAAVAIPSPKGGKLVSVAGKVGDVVVVGDVIAVIAAEGEEAVAAPALKEPAAKEAKPPKKEAPPPEKPILKVVAIEGPVACAPATRRFAREKGVDIKLVTPTGPGGRVTLEDVERFAAGEKAPAPAKAVPEPVDEKRAEAAFAAHAASAIPFLDIEPMPDFEQWGAVEREPLRSIRRKVARKMVTSMILIPHVAHMDEADVTLLEEFRQREKARRTGQPGGHLTLLAFIVKAVTAGLKATPSFNASLDPFREEIVYKKYYNIGIATDTGRGLVVPVIKDTDRKSILQISAGIVDLASRARDGKIDVDDLRGGTFTITNVGPLGGTALIPTINYPEVAILGVGRVQEKPVVRDGQIVIRKILPLTLAFDHRIADGADAARFVTEMVRQLSDPNLLLLET